MSFKNLSVLAHVERIREMLSMLIHNYHMCAKLL